MKEPTLPGKVVALSEALRKAKIAYAFGGALALAYYAQPRATADIDLNVFVPPTRFGDVAKALRPLGVDTETDAEALERDAQCRLRWGRTPVDLFMFNIEFHAVMREAVRRVSFDQTTIQIVAPEHLVICKAIFNRPKDWIDIEQMLLSMPDLDQSEIEDWLDIMVGKRDDRAKRFKRLAD